MITQVYIDWGWGGMHFGDEAGAKDTDTRVTVTFNHPSKEDIELIRSLAESCLSEGKSSEVKVDTRTCGECSGKGRLRHYIAQDESEVIDCPVCKGTGKRDRVFQIGRYYKHTGGRMIHILMESETEVWGHCFIAEESESNSLCPVGMDSDAAGNWKEIPKKEFKMGS
ncbi:MAG: hypothetical protein IMZ47_03090 [Firmicutes bacterium]|nr:hypothetical protein [Bacillota bacterium]